MMRVVIYGAGKIGRGYLAMMLSRAKVDFTFIDIDSSLVNELNRRDSYPVRILSGGHYREETVRGYAAIDAHDEEKVVAAIGDCDLLMTCVGVNNLIDIAPLLARGIMARRAPLNILICENLVGSDDILRGHVAAHGDCSNAGFVSASIGCAAPVMTDRDKLMQMIDCDPKLPIDGRALIGKVNIDHIHPVDNFDFYIQRKLFIHNMGHSACAYLGLLRGIDKLDDAMRRMDILSVTRSAMRESARALAAAYDEDLDALYQYIDELIERFKNPALGDTCARVGNDPIRKLSPNDRLIGAMKLCEAQGVTPEHIAKAAAAAVRHAVGADRDAAVALLRDVSGLSEVSPPSKMIMRGVDENL